MNKVFTKDIEEKTSKLLERYETKRAGMLEVLHILMEAYGHITLEMEEAVAERLEVSPMDVREVVTFYTLYYTKKKAGTRFNVCRTLTCHLAGAGKIVNCLEKHLGIRSGQTTPDGAFEVKEVECLGACEIAPMLQLNDGKYIGNLTEEKVLQLIKDAKKLK